MKLYIVTSYISRSNRTGSIKKLNLITILGLLVVDLCRFVCSKQIVERDYDTYLCGILVIFVILGGFRSLKKLSILFSIYIVICFIDMLVVGFLTTNFSLDISLVLANPIYKIIMNSVTIPLYLAIGYIIRLFNVNFRLELMSKKDIYLFIIGIVGCGFYIAPYQIFANNSDDLSVRKILILGISILGFIMVVVAIILILKNNNLKHFKELQQLQEQLLLTQQSYYEERLQQEQETRKFRHDINEHLYCISYLIKNSNYQELQSYVGGLTDTFNEINEKSVIQTGSDLITIILCDLIKQYSNQHISLSWHNQIPVTNIENKDLCSLFSNLLRNAFEAANKCHDKIIDVDIQQQGNSFFIKISNTCLSPVKILDNVLISTKSNSSKHGYGSLIILDIVNKYNGQLKYYNDTNYFSAEITFLNVCNS